MTKRFTQLGRIDCLPKVFRGAKIILLFLLVGVLNLMAAPVVAGGKGVLQKIKITGVVTSSKDQQPLPMHI